MNFLILIYKYILSRPFFYKLNRKLIEISLNNIGILNYEDDYFNGEELFIKQIAKDLKVVFDVGCNVGNFTQKLFKINNNLKVLGTIDGNTLNITENIKSETLEVNELAKFNKDVTIKDLKVDKNLEVNTEANIKN